ncbi:MAG: ferritin family protein [Deltaproteobacteria bacterium]|jgi:rubrerythrin|nr:ferritin family protein [Deltaproteobacteria bacterium]
MDMFEFAIQMEKDAETLYLKMAAEAPVEGIKKVLLMLAEEEARHRFTIEQLQKKQGISPAKGVALEIKTVFAELRHDKSIIQISEDALDDYQKALKIEEKGIQFYKEQFAKAKDEASAKLFEVLMKQESYHYKTVENVLEMVRKPQWWVEDAEFNPRDSVYY